MTSHLSKEPMRPVEEFGMREEHKRALAGNHLHPVFAAEFNRFPAD